MAEPRHRRMTPDEFLEWQKRQDRNYELVDGLPMLPLKAMTGATRRHDRVVTNTMFALMRQLHGGPCWPTTDDIATCIPAGNIRRPDITVECGGPADARMEAQEPVAVIEVLSPSTMSFDRLRKLEEYKTVAAIRAILLVDTEAARIDVWRRSATGWALESYDGLGATVPLPEIGAELPLAGIYEKITFGEARTFEMPS
jgi:Uma2 family endonuclease